MEKIILLLIIKVSIIMSNHLQKANMEIEKSIIIVNELSDEYIDKKKQIEEAYSEQDTGVNKILYLHNGF